MSKFVRRYVIPLAILIIGSFLVSFLHNLSMQHFAANIYYILVVLMLFAFGFALNNQKSKLKNFSWRHIIIVLLLVFLYLYDTGVFKIKLFSFVEKYLLADNFIIKLFYVYFGWLFNER